MSYCVARIENMTLLIKHASDILVKAVPGYFCRDPFITIYYELNVTDGEILFRRQADPRAPVKRARVKLK